MGVSKAQQNIPWCAWHFRSNRITLCEYRIPNPVLLEISPPCHPACFLLQSTEENSWATVREGAQDFSTFYTQRLRDILENSYKINFPKGNRLSYYFPIHNGNDFLYYTQNVNLPRKPIKFCILCLLLNKSAFYPRYMPSVEILPEALKLCIIFNDITNIYIVCILNIVNFSRVFSIHQIILYTLYADFPVINCLCYNSLYVNIITIIFLSHMKISFWHYALISLHT